MKNSHVYILLGGMTGGAVDYPTTLGMFNLRDQLIAAGFDVTTYWWGEWLAAEANITAIPGRLAIVIGYSGGGSRATWMQSHIDLLIGYDPSPASQVKPIGPNVAKAICYYNAHPFMWVPFVGWLGNGRYIGPQVTQIDINEGKGEWHLAVDYDQTLHEQTIAACKALVT